ncbi:tripartite tricarboxylate transporter substrate binding protein [Pusillimonas sp. TS35]|nr:tripartite tricarboxylate transporter substrate binding protein [Pusillimonas sp. TS35]
MKRSSFLARISGAALLAGLAFPVASTQATTGQTLNVVVGLSAGGALDAIARSTFDSLKKHMQPAPTVIVENRPGANGRIAGDYVVKAPADGRTLWVAASGHATINPFLFKNMNYDPLEDLKPVAIAAHVKNVLVASAAIPPNNLREMIEWGRKNPERVMFASSGTGSMAHLMSVIFQQASGLPVTHVPYKGMADAVTDISSGRVPFAVDTLQTMLPLAKAGKIKILAITSSERWHAVPDVATVREQGYPQLEISSWAGIFVPAKTADATIETLNNDLTVALSSPSMTSTLNKFGMDFRPMSVNETRDFVKQQASRWKQIILANKIAVE